MVNPGATDQPFIRKLTDIVLANISNEHFGVKELAQASGMSRYRLNKKLEEITGQTINRLIREATAVSMTAALIMMYVAALLFFYLRQYKLMPNLSL